MENAGKKVERHGEGELHPRQRQRGYRSEHRYTLIAPLCSAIADAKHHRPRFWLRPYDNRPSLDFTC